MSKTDPPHPALRLSAFYAASFLVVGIQSPFWPVWLAGRGLDAREIGLVLAAALWAKVIATPALGALADRFGSLRAMMAGLAAIAAGAYAVLWPAAGFWALLSCNLVAATAQSSLMPLGDSVTLAAARDGRVDYGRVRVWGSLSFILAALGSGAVLGAASGDRVLLLVFGASGLLLLACLAVPRLDEAAMPARRRGLGGLAGDPRFWLFAATAGMLQASHQVYYGFATLHWRSLGFSNALIGWLWAEGVIAEIALFWLGRRLIARLGPLGLMALGGGAGILRWSLMGTLPGLPFATALQALHALTFGASHLGAMHYLARTVPANAAASAQALYAALSAGLGSGLVMLIAGQLYAAYGGHAYLFMAPLSAAGLIGTYCIWTISRRY
jgi:MFS transporter, PPP family, 3-phenylpropionic acid transporter